MYTIPVVIQDGELLHFPGHNLQLAVGVDNSFGLFIFFNRRYQPANFCIIKNTFKVKIVF